MSLTARNFTVICEVCEEEFKSKASNAKRCSEVCREIATKKREQERLAETKKPNTNMTSKSQPTKDTMAKSNEWLSMKL